MLEYPRLLSFVQPKIRNLRKQSEILATTISLVKQRPIKDAAIDSKTMLRRKILNLLRAQKKEDWFKKSKIILNKLFSTVEFKKANVILFYASFDGEVETFEMMKKAQKLGKKIALPIIIKDQKKIIPTQIQELDKDLHPGPFGIKAPQNAEGCSVDVEKLDLVIVPGIAFDKHNNRLGRGAGYYDRFLGRIPSRVPAFGLAFDFQIVDSLPHPDKHDIKVSRVIVN